MPPSQWLVGRENINKECDVKGPEQILSTGEVPGIFQKTPSKTLSELEVSYTLLREKSPKSG